MNRVDGLAGVTVAKDTNGPPSVDTKRPKDLMPEGGLPSEPLGSLPVTETVKLEDVVV